MQLKAFLEGLEKSASYRDGASLHIFLEKGPPTYCPITRWRGVLSDIDEAVEGEGVDRVTVEDIEIRRRMGAVLSLFKSKGNLPADFICARRGDEPILFNELTLQDYIDEFNEWVDYLDEFYKSIKDRKGSGYIGERLDYALSYFHSAMCLLAATDIQITDSLYDVVCKGIDKSKAIDYNLHKAAVHLFDVNLFKKIYEHKGTHIAFVVGSDHLNTMWNIISGFQGKEIYYQTNKNHINREDAYIPLLSKEQILEAFCYMPPFKAFMRKMLAIRFSVGSSMTILFTFPRLLHASEKWSRD